MEYQQYLRIVLTEIFPQHGFINTLQFYDILCYSLRTILVNEPFGNVVSDGMFWLLVEHKYEQLTLLRLLLVLADVVQLHYKLAVALLPLPPHPLQFDIIGVAVLL